MLESFPDVNPDSIELAGHRFQLAAAEMANATDYAKSVLGTSSWHAPHSRPVWNSALSARVADLGEARDVLEHVGNVLRTTAAEIVRCQRQYQSAQLALDLSPDPRASAITSVNQMLNHDKPDVDQAALEEYRLQVSRSNHAVDEANYVLAVCAEQLLAVSDRVAFVAPPAVPGRAVDLRIGAIVPLTPAFGAPIGAIYANGVPVQFLRGAKFEAQILRDLGIIEAEKEFFRPDADGDYGVPRTATGLYRGTFPDSMRAGLLEIKSGITTLTMRSAQLKVQQWVARALRTPWNLVTESDTPVDEEVAEAVSETGGSIYSRLPGDDAIYFDRGTGRYVRLSGGNGTGGDELEAAPLTPAEVAQIDAEVRSDVQGTTPVFARPASDPYTTQSEYSAAWSNANISPEGDTPLPGTTGSGTVRPIEPAVPGPELSETSDVVLPDGEI